jgi:hypothetical protein
MKLRNSKSIMALRFGFFFALVIISSVARAQSSLLKEVMHHSPNVSTLGKFGEVPVGYYTGIPNITIPIFEASSGPLRLPVSLDYHAGGVRVEEVASNVGLSWALQAGGVITRNVRGYPDYEGTWWNVASPNRIADYKNNYSIPPDELLFAIENGHADGEADIFSFSFGTRSGRFILDQNNVDVHTLPKSKLAITRYGLGWKIVDETGTQYLFQKSEWQYSLDMDIENSWVLTDIISSDLQHSISLFYDNGYINYPIYTGGDKSVSLNQTSGCGGSGSSYSNVNSSVQRLTRISFETGYIQFTYGADRCDVLADKVLDEIAIYSKEGALIKKFVLAHSYFGVSTCNSGEPDKMRLKLTSVTESTSTETKPPYVFTYDESAPLPSTMSLSQDHWGYYNGASNLTLAPGYLSGPLTYFRGADRRVNPATAQLGVLKSIKYPTGGSTNFTYESNMANENNLGPAEFEALTLSYSFSTPNVPVLNMPSPLPVTPLVVPAGGAIVDAFIITGLSTSPWPYCDVSGVWLTKNGVAVTKLESGVAAGDFASLIEEGTYSLSIVHDCPSQAIMPSFSVYMRVLVPKTIGPNDLIYVGGLRIKKLEDVPGDGGLPVVREFKYGGGTLSTIPVYTSNLTIYKTEFFPNGSSIGTTCNDLVVSGHSNYPLATTLGSYVGYNKVTEVLPNGAENEYSFLTFSGTNYPTIPFAPFQGQDWKRGFLSGVKSYAKVGGQLLLAKESSNGFSEFGETVVWGLKVGRTAKKEYAGPIPEGVIPTQLVPDAYTYYPTSSVFFDIQSTVEKVYPEPGNLTKVIETKTEYTYDQNHYQVTETKETLIDGQGGSEIKINRKKYPLDFSFTGTPVGVAAQGIKKLQDLHIVATPVEEYVVKQYQNAQNQISNQRVVSGVLTSFKPDKPYPDRIDQLELSQPVALTNFAPSTISNNTFQKSTLYKPAVNFLMYDGKGNLLAQQKANDVVTSYLWGYDNTLPVAEVKNATNASATAQFPFTNNASVTITEYIGDTPVLPAFEITSSQQLSMTVGLIGSGTNLPTSPLVNLILKRTDGTTVSGVNGVWGQNTYSILVSPGTYQWYYSTGDISFYNPDFISVSLNVSHSYSAVKTGSRIFHTSFEDEGNYTSLSYTGKKAWQGPYTVYLPAQNGNYRLSYTRWNGSSWEYMQQAITVTSGVVQTVTIGTASSIIDEVRLYPSEGQMTTFSYDTRFGMTSAADANCKVTYYDYDSFGRLKNIKDHQRNMVKAFEYHYKGGN